MLNENNIRHVVRVKLLRCLDLHFTKTLQQIQEQLRMLQLREVC